MCLAVKYMTSSHTAERIKADEVLNEYKITEDKVSRYRTDNGSNMIAAFRESMVEVSAKLMDDDFEENAEVVADGNLDQSFDESNNFDQQAVEFKRVFPKLLDCTAHSLQLPLRKVVDNDPLLNAIRTEVFSLLNKFSKSETATRCLKEKCGKKLVTPGLTRWNTLCLTYERLLEIRDSVDEVCVERRWCTLGETYGILEVLTDMLHPFLNFTNFLQGEKYVTISSTIPTILNLLMDLESPDPADRWQVLGDVPKQLAVELRKRFQHVVGFQQREEGFDSTYLVSTLLDPNTAYLLSPTEQRLAKRELLIMTYDGQKNSSEDLQDVIEMVNTTGSPQPSVSRFNRLAKLSAAKHQVEKIESVMEKTDEDEVDAYLKQFARHAPNENDINAIEFWRKHKEEFPKLGAMAFDLLAIPATSSAVERVFSQAGLSTGGRKCQTGVQLLELECMMKYNKKYLHN